MTIELISAGIALACLWFAWRCWRQQYRGERVTPNQLAGIAILLFVAGVRLLFWSNAFAWNAP